MEGVLWTREGRGKLLRGWHKRYFVLSEGGSLREYAADVKSKKELLARARRASSGASSTASSSPDRPNVDSGMTLTREWPDIRGAVVKTLAFPLVGKHNAFQVNVPISGVADKLVLSARQADEVRQWTEALRSAALKLAIPRRPSPMGWSRESDARTSETSTFESDFLEVKLPQRADMAHLSSVYEWIHECCVKTSQSVTVAGVHVPRGSLLVSANGVSLQTLTSVEVKKLLLESTGPLPVALRFLRSPAKCGVLRAKLYTSPLTQLKSLARYRKSSRMNWKEQVVDLSGDLLTCQLKVKTPMAIGNSRKSSNSSSKTKRVLVLTSGSAVKPVHELVADRKFCFMVTVQAHAMLFQARSEADRRAWTDAIQRAITIAEGLVPGGALARGSFDLDALQLQSSMNMRHLDQAFEGMEESDVFDSDDEAEASDDDVDEELSPDGASSLPLAADWISATQSAAYLPDAELTEMLRVLQSSGRFIEALQLMQKNTTLRGKYWPQIFRWALNPVRSDADSKELFQQLTGAPLSEEDASQVQKDIPRTVKWLAGSAGAPKLDDAERAVRLESLEHVLHAFLSSCSLDERTDEEPVSPSSAGSSSPSSPSFYMQGMNGLAFILLEVLENDQVEAFRFLRGIIARILPHVFGICCEGTGRDHFDLFRSLVEVGDVLQEVARLHLPSFHAALERAGLPVCLLAYKWFPTLFSDVTLTASHSQLRFDTLLCCWDVCLLLGLEGMFCVALALCSAAEDDVLALAGCGEAVSNSAEQVSATVGRALALLTPEDLITSVCEVLELCSHPVLLKLRNAHRRRLKLGYSKVGNGFAASASRASPDRTVKKKPRDAAAPPPMTVTDLDSGKVFKISNSGNMLLPTATSQ